MCHKSELKWILSRKTQTQCLRNCGAGYSALSTPILWKLSCTTVLPMCHVKSFATPPGSPRRLKMKKSLTRYLTTKRLNACKPYLALHPNSKSNRDEKKCAALEFLRTEIHINHKGVRKAWMKCCTSVIGNCSSVILCTHGQFLPRWARVAEALPEPWRTHIEDTGNNLVEMNVYTFALLALKVILILFRKANGEIMLSEHNYSHAGPWARLTLRIDDILRKATIDRDRCVGGIIFSCCLDALTRQKLRELREMNPVMWTSKLFDEHPFLQKYL
eukprot:IDg23423t1